MSEVLRIWMFTVCTVAFGSRIKIVNNGYENILFALPRDAPIEDRDKLVLSLKTLLEDSSSILVQSTKGRAQFRSAVFLVPESWGDVESWWPNHNKGAPVLEHADAWMNSDSADVSVFTGNEHPYVLHQGGCGRPSLRISLPYRFLVKGKRKDKAVQFVRLWSEFRYGVFPEVGFKDDLKFPQNYQMPGENMTSSTGCSNALNKNTNNCNVNESCDNEAVVSSIMDPQLPPTAVSFCEGELSLGPRHNPESPSKHNLLCHEEGTWFTLLRSPDFKLGKNAPPKNSSRRSEVRVRLVKENSSPAVIVAVDASSGMRIKNRYSLVKNAFSYFLTSHVPGGSELLVFGHSSPVHLTDDESRIRFLESQPLPEEPLHEDGCIDCILQDIIELVDNGTFTSAPSVVLVTAGSTFNTANFAKIKEKLDHSQLRLHLLRFSDGAAAPTELYQLCSETENHFVNLEDNSLRSLYSAFAETVKGPQASVQIAQEYLSMSEDESMVFVVDDDLGEVSVSLSGPQFIQSPLMFDSTIITDPRGLRIPPKKLELVPSWNWHLSEPIGGEYRLETRRKEGSTSPVLVSIHGKPKGNTDHISARVWVEMLESKGAVQLFAEVKRGRFPVINATVMATVHSPGHDETSEISLLDDGNGNVDTTAGDGIYSRYFTNVSSAGLYNVYLKVSGDEYSAILKGPDSPCCGSAFPWSEEAASGKFHRFAGPATFQVVEERRCADDLLPPARVTDLRLDKTYDSIAVVTWSAVGDDLDQGVATSYELKLFRDRQSIRHRFDSPATTVHSETIETTEDAEHGRQLYHVMRIPEILESGVYYFGIRGIDDAGNSGEPSNAVPVWIEGRRNSDIDCSSEMIAEKLKSRGSLCKTLPTLGFFVVSLLYSFIILH